MEITREVILDLLPLYLANEVSSATRALIEEYLETDPKLAKLARQQKAAIELPGENPTESISKVQGNFLFNYRIIGVIDDCHIGDNFDGLFYPSLVDPSMRYCTLLQRTLQKRLILRSLRNE